MRKYRELIIMYKRRAKRAAYVANSDVDRHVQSKHTGKWNRINGEREKGGWCVYLR